MKVLSNLVGGERREAAFSDCMKYRYRLEICWDPNLKCLVTIGLNPSTADHLQDDPTIRKCKELARDMGYGSYMMLNAFAWRSTDYKALFRVPDPIGPGNTLDYLKTWCDGAFVIACWGAHITEKPWRHYYRGMDIAKAIPNLFCLQVTKSGHPQHPLYLKKSLRPVRFAYE